jgi:Hint module
MINVRIANASRSKRNRYDMVKNKLILVILLLLAPVAAPIAWVNEIHYENWFADEGEFIEIAHTGGNVNGYKIVLYNGATAVRKSYATIVISNSTSTDGFTVVHTPQIQNGGNRTIDPDAIAFVHSNGTLLEFLSYEGSFVAADGVANGATSTDIGVAEDETTPVGYSLQKCPDARPNRWIGPLPDTKGKANNCAPTVPVPVRQPTTPTKPPMVPFIAPTSRPTISHHPSVSISPSPVVPAPKSPSVPVPVPKPTVSVPVPKPTVPVPVPLPTVPVLVPIIAPQTPPVPVGSLPTPPSCLSRYATVEVQGIGSIPIDQLQIGQYVKTQNNLYTRVYSFGHYAHHIETEFLVFELQHDPNTNTNNETSWIEISSQHLIFASRKDGDSKSEHLLSPIPAHDVVIGDVLSNQQVVISIDRITRQGVYAPFTESGDFMIHPNILISNYVQLIDSNWMIWNHQHTIGHILLYPYRFFCSYLMNQCRQETYDPVHGYSFYVYWIITLSSIVNRCGSIISFLTTLFVHPFVMMTTMP